MTREEAIEVYNGLINTKIKEAFEFFAPELRESEDERTRKAIIETIDCLASGDTQFISEDTRQRYITYLEKQEQKPVSTEDMPYIADEHFYEREPADTFKYKLAEYMTKNCRKEEGPDGYTYHISAETILKMAEEELLKRGVVQKSIDLPAGFYVTLPNGEKYYAKEMRCNNMKVRVVTPQPPVWSEEDSVTLDCAVEVVEKAGLPSLAASLKSLRPQPREEIYKAAKHDLAIKFMNYLDENRPEGKMGLSNGECEDIDKAFKENDWAKIVRYAEKYRPSS